MSRRSARRRGNILIEELILLILLFASFLFVGRFAGHFVSHGDQRLSRAEQVNVAVVQALLLQRALFYQAFQQAIFDARHSGDTREVRQLRKARRVVRRHFD